MQTNNYSSDFGLNADRVDIVLKEVGGLDTVADIIESIKQGNTVIMTCLNCFDDVYDNKLVNELNKIGINDVRFGTMGCFLNNGIGYTIYKG